MFRRGYKSWCEQVAAKLRRDADLGPIDPIPPAVIAADLNVRLIPASELADLPAGTLDRLLHAHNEAWSAITVSDGDRHLVVYNPAHSDARQANDIAHELAHIILKHTPTFSFMNPEKQLLIRSFDKNQEDEANWLAASILLPRAALVAMRSKRVRNEEICSRYGISTQLLTYRLNTTGVDRQMARRKAIAR
jgi:Zn-dependent peptidase ImmA (M78 family)